MPTEQIRSVASYIPAKIRAVIYSVLALAIALEAIWNVIPDAFDGRVLQTVSVLGFGQTIPTPFVSVGSHARSANQDTWGIGWPLGTMGSLETLTFEATLTCSDPNQWIDPVTGGIVPSTTPGAP